MEAEIGVIHVGSYQKLEEKSKRFFPGPSKRLLQEPC